MKLITSSRAAAVAAIALSLAMPVARADILVDNLSQPIRNTSTLPSEIWAAQSFVTAADPVRLLSIEMPLSLAVGNPNIFAELHADAGSSQVGAKLASLLLPPVSTSALQIELLPALPALDLAP
jgi:hypothetical protein